MTMRYLLIPLALASAQAMADVHVEGDVAAPQHREYTPGLRLHDVLAPAVVSLRAYRYGAAWLHVPAREGQRRLKLGVLFDLEQVQRAALEGNRPELAARASELHAWVEALPITGRTLANLDPLVVELDGTRNFEVADGDRLLYPRRPGSVQVLGALTDCHLPFRPLRRVREYVAECASKRPLADPDWLYLLQPDGSVHKLGAAAWNRDDQAPLPAPGARIYVPLRTLSGTPDLNDELAALIATQPLALDNHE